METENLKPIQSGVTKPNHERVAAPVERRTGRKTMLLVLFALIIVGTAAVFMVLKSRGTNLQAASEPVVTVAAARVTRQDVYDEVPIPAEFRPYVESELHAIVTGYVSQMNVDFGDKVKQGQILATLEVPELTDQLHNAEATLQQADADYANAHQIYTRLQEVNQQHPKLVAQQDIDTAQSKDASSAGAIAAAKANVEKYQTLVNYTKIVAPFDGVITQRSADPGALVQAGTSSDRSMPLVRVSDNYHLRLDFPVSVEYVKDVHLGDPVTVRVDSLDGKTFTGKITRFTDEVNDETRTMTTEMELDNPNLELVPGMYAVALFKFEQHSNVLTVPTEAIRDPKDPVVYVINADNEVEARPVKLGVEMPNKYEITDGLKEGELVMIGNGAQVHPGQKVDPKLVAQPTIQ
ncbi:MAG: efflux RND transporter periplasmic adaptor subunit [Chthoniobacteraceae bacterium]|jgi:RND family efflux transporter MFP subunit